SVVAAFYQAYLVQAKQWGRSDLRTAIQDSWIGISVLALIGIVIMIGAAQALHGTGEDFGSVGALAEILKGVLGPAAIWVFCFGLAAASFSSFIVNAMVGGNLFADGVGLDPGIDGPHVKLVTAAIMLIGCFVAVGTLAFGRGGTQSLLIAQASTLLAVPLSAALLLVLTSRRKTMGDLKNGPVTVVFGVIGLMLVVWLGGGTVVQLVSKLSGS
ncbi:MAG TPA: hypothetical protein ENN80_10640, partial [Candidatus Hydrogenedentes bacterium]|nr:hypothetical protein [Candidatus Hydrogenedentota bacterium]